MSNSNDDFQLFDFQSIIDRFQTVDITALTGGLQTVDAATLTGGLQAVDTATLTGGLQAVDISVLTGGLYPFDISTLTGGLQTNGTSVAAATPQTFAAVMERIVSIPVTAIPLRDTFSATLNVLEQYQSLFVPYDFNLYQNAISTLTVGIQRLETEHAEPFLEQVIDLSDKQDAIVIIQNCQEALFNTNSQQPCDLPQTNSTSISSQLPEKISVGKIVHFLYESICLLAAFQTLFPNQTQNVVKQLHIIIQMILSCVSLLPF